MRKLIVLGLLAGLAVLAALTAMPAGGKVPGPNGRIAFARFDPALDGTVTYTANPDGSDVQQLFSAGHRRPRWSPDGSEVAVLAACTDGEENCASTIVDPDTGSIPSAQDGSIPPSSPPAHVVAGRQTTRLRGLRRDRPEPERHLHDPLLRRRRPDPDHVQPGGDDFPATTRPTASASSSLASTRTATPSACSSSRPTAATCDRSRLRGRLSAPPATGRRRGTRSCSPAA